MPTFTYPTNAILMEIAQDFLPQLMLNDPIFSYMPIVMQPAELVIWEQEDSSKGLQGVRGIDGQPNRVKPLGGKRFSMEPGSYGDVSIVGATELTRLRNYGTFGDTISLDKIIAKRQRQLLDRQIKRLCQIGWTLFSTGTFSNFNKYGQVAHTDTYSMQSYTAGIPWSTVATATPLQNLREVLLLARGHSVVFDSSATAFMNQVTFQALSRNINAADIYGTRTAGLATVIGINDINNVLLLNGLPKIAVYDKGYLNDSNTFIPYIPNNTVIVFGNREDGESIAQYQMTPCAEREDLGPGQYSRVTDSINSNNGVPREIQVHLGHNGGPALLFPSAVVRMTV